MTFAEHFGVSQAYFIKRYVLPPPPPRADPPPPPVRSVSPRGNTIENSPRRDDIERALDVGIPLRTIEARFGISKSALSRHKKRFRVTRRRAGSMLRQVDWLTEDMIEVIDLARSENDKGERYIKMMTLVRALKKEFNIVFSAETIRRRVCDYIGGKW